MVRAKVRRTVEFDPGLYERLMELAQQQQRSISGLIVEAVQEYLDRQTSARSQPPAASRRPRSGRG